MIIGNCFLFYIGPNFYSILIHRTEEPQSIRAILQILLPTVIWFAGVSGVVKSRFIKFAILFTLYTLVGIALVLLVEQRSAMHFLAPVAHCLGCLVGTVSGLYFNRLGINAVSGCLLGIISAALIMQSIEALSRDDDIDISFQALYFMGNIIGFLFLKFTHGTVYGILFGMILGMFIGFTGMVF